MPHRVEQFKRLSLLSLKAPVSCKTDDCAPVLLRRFYEIPRLLQQRE
jgi:hypothetical protein